jgi:putative proteasome-type protease
MTFCLAMRVEDGLVGIADTRVISGSECITAKKVSVYHEEQAAFFVMSSGLRAVRDKALTYFEEIIEDAEQPLFGRLFRVANLFAEQIRRVATEDKQSLEDSGFRFNIHALIGGQLSKDREHKLFLLYPEGNWVEISRGTPYHIIGASGYGKPVLDRTLKYEDPMRFALKVGCLAFDSTRISAADVDFPVDVVLYARTSLREERPGRELQLVAGTTSRLGSRAADRLDGTGACQAARPAGGADEVIRARRERLVHE